MKRLLVLLVAVAGLLAAACTNGQSALDPTALSVDGATVSVAQLEEEMAWLEDNPSVASRLFAPGMGGMGGPQELEVRGDAPGSWNPDVVAQVLTLHAQSFLVEEAVRQLAGEITEADRSAAESDLDSQLGEPNPQTGMIDDGTVASMPDGLRQALVTLVAANEASQRAALADGGVEVTEADLQERYDEAVAMFEEQQAAMAPQEPGPCASHILFAFDADAPGAGQATDEQREAALEAAEDALAELEAGADFADLATQLSDDPGSAAEGGRLPCEPVGSYVPEFEEATAELEVGEISEPVVTDFGVHIIRREADEDTVEVDEPEIPSFEEIRGELAAQMEAERANELLEERLGPIFEAVLENAEVEVDPRFGSWDESLVQVVPPEGSSPAPTAPAVGDDEVQGFDDLQGLEFP